ncbi:MAG TPA: hypothetical protein VF328_26015 [Mycobacterium sp.]
MARYGRPDDPNYYSDDEPTAYAANYGDQSGYGRQPGPPPEPPVPWYRKPSPPSNIPQVPPVPLPGG